MKYKKIYFMETTAFSGTVFMSFLLCKWELNMSSRITMMGTAVAKTVELQWLEH